MPARWAAEAEEMIEDLYGRLTVKAIAARINKTLGANYTPRAVWKKANRMGLDYRDAQGFMTISETARQLGVPKKTIMRGITLLGITPMGRSPRARFLRDADVEQLRAKYARPAVPTVSTAEAAKALGVSPATVANLIKRGQLRAHRAGKLWLVEAAQLERRDTWGRPA